MKKLTQVVLCIALLHPLVLSAFAQGTAFTYQGRLNDGANPANGNYDLRFAIYDLSGGGSQQGGALTTAAAAVSNGLFTVTLDFGNQFPGADRWLEIAVRTNGGGAFATLIPRQPITATPYAVAAGTVTGAITEAQLPANSAKLNVANTTSQATGTATITSGFITSANVTFGGAGYLTPPTVTVNAGLGSGAIIMAGVLGGAVVNLTVVNPGSGYTSGATLTLAPPPSNGYQVFTSTNYFTTANFLTNGNNTFVGNFSGNGAGLTNLPAWQLGGNAGTTAGVNFLGTTDNQPLEFKVNNQRGLRLEPTANPDTVNVIGGSARNFVGAGVAGATIGGGGTGDWFGSSYTNRVEADFGTVAGGADNNIQTDADYATIGGGATKTRFSPTPTTRPSAGATQTGFRPAATARPSAGATQIRFSPVSTRPSAGATKT